jgi:large subunit ribosomal protein L3
LGLPRERYKGRPFTHAFLEKKSKHFAHIKEVPVEEKNIASYAIGKILTIKDFNLAPNDAVHVAGTSIGVGFQGGVKRYGFAGGPAAHGSTFHRKPGSVGAMRTQGNVIKGKRLPGQCGGTIVTVKNLKVVKVDQESNCLFVKGAVPGKKNSLLYIRKQV